MPCTSLTALYFKSCSKLAQKSMASVLSWISTGMDSFLSKKNTGMRAMTCRLRYPFGFGEAM